MMCLPSCLVHIRIEDLNLHGDPPQIYLSHCKKNRIGTEAADRAAAASQQE